MKYEPQEEIDAGISFFDLPDIPDLQLQILLCLTRDGPADSATVAQATGLDQAEVQAALTTLLQEGRLRLMPGGQVDVVTGRARGRRTLPAELWRALLTTDRLYSEQDIALLRTAVPILQFARARLAEFVDHGPGHALRVKSYSCQLGHVMGLTQPEQALLRAAALFHDVGNAVDRERHNAVSQETVIRLAASGELPFTPEEADVVGLLCRWHRREYDPERTDTLGGDLVRTGMLASILRVADAMDIDQRRSDYTDRFFRLLQFFYPGGLRHWTSLKEVLGVRICCTPAVQLQVVTLGKVTGNIQIEMLRRDLGATPLDWAVDEVAVCGDLAVDGEVATDGEDVERRAAPGRAGEPGRGRALLVFPFEPHSLIMAALSRKHLAAAGHEVELLCYPDTAEGPAWLWGEALAGAGPDKYGRLVVIGDRPVAARPVDDAAGRVLEEAGRWRGAGVSVSVLNRYEANWLRLPALLETGVEAVLGGDWAYFWGDACSKADIAWGRVAGLCTRDPIQSTAGLAGEDQAVAQGFLKVVYDSKPADDAEGWAAAAKPILDLIQADDRACFAGQAAAFAETYAQPGDAGRVEGRVLRLEQSSGGDPRASFWAMEAAIERHGRAPERGISFRVPYAIATWPDGDGVELLAINHWREEEATPILLLYPDDVGPRPMGNECAIQVRLPRSEAGEVIRRLTDRCNTTPP